MKTKIMAFMFALLCTTALMAQAPQGGSRMANMTPESRAKFMADRMKTQLSLSAEQAKQIQDIYLESFKQEQAIAEKRQTDIKKVLTPEQAKKMDQAEQQMRDRMNQGGQGQQGQGGQRQRGAGNADNANF